MDIYLATQRAFHFVAQVSIEEARDRVEQKKTNLVAGTFGALFSRPKPEEIRLVSVENRLEPFWMTTVFMRTVYDRGRTYTIPVGGPEVQRVTTLGQDLPVTSAAKGSASFTLSGVEHCLEERRVSHTFDGATGAKVDMSKYLPCPKADIPDLEQFAPADMLVVPPQMHASAVVRGVLADAIQPVQAQVIHEERVDVEALELIFRPVYALEYEWTTKGKRVVIEFDPVLIDMHPKGKKLGDQIKRVVNRDLIFDLTADAVGLVVPGGSAAVKIVKAVVDRGK
jgi:hypothetical protein